jgi:hypothetical protein
MDKLAIGVIRGCGHEDGDDSGKGYKTGAS